MKRIYSFLLVVTMLGTPMFSVPAVALTDEGSNDGQTSTKQREIEASRAQKASELSAKLADICKRYTETKLGRTTDDKRNEFTTRLSQKGTDLGDKRSEWDDKRTEARLMADQKREEHYAKLTEKAVTDVQKQAVEVFKQAVEKAVSDRRTAQDTARQSYRSGVDAILANRKSTLEAESGDFKLAVEAALAKAKTSCENGTPVDTVKSVLKTDLEAAKSALKTAKDENGKVSEEIRALVEVRKTAIQSAKEAFDAAMQDAKTALETALGVESSGSSE